MALRDDIVQLLKDYGFDDTMPAFRAMADEIVRQMRWSRHSLKWADPDRIEWDDGNPNEQTAEPTLAPDKWESE